jgi:anthranilate phosphoribosyltransferase
VPADADLGALIRHAAVRPLTAAEAEAAFGEVMEGRATPVQIAALLVAIRVRGAVSSEVAGGVRALRRAMVPVPGDAAGLVDTCGTGGGAITTFNISTAAALLAAGAGARVAKHGNRSFTSRCGSADVLEALGIRLELTPEQEARVLERTGIVFMFAPLHHPAMKHVGPIRRELGMPTIMNVLGPVTNPAAELGWAAMSADGLEGGDREENAAKVEAVLRGRLGGAARAAVVLNAGAAIYCADLAPSLVDGVRAAEAALDAGRGWAKLEELRDASA